MEREKVFAVIDGERKYQQDMVASEDRPDMVDLSAGDTISAIEFNLRKAQEAWYIGSAPHPQMMKYLRKIAALCVAAGEKYGMKERE